MNIYLPNNLVDDLEKILEYLEIDERVHFMETTDIDLDTREGYQEALKDDTHIYSSVLRLQYYLCDKVND